MGSLGIDNNINILVTGGTGFVGSHLVEELIKTKANIVSTYLEIEPKGYFFSKKFNRDVTLAKVNVEDFEEIFNLVTKYEIDVIFHLAAQPLVDVALANPAKTIKTNVMGTVNVLECARLYPKIKAVICASSDKAYGKMENGEKYLETDALRGDHPYEVSKSSADLIANTYFKTYNVPVVTTRFGNIYGEGDLYFNRLIPGVIKALITDEVFHVRSNGEFVRDYIYVKDVVRGYLKLAQEINKVRGEAFNFGSNESLSVLDVIRICSKVYQKQMDINILNIEQNEIPFQSLNFEKIKNVIGWEPENNLEIVLSKMFEWYGRVLK